MSWIFIILFLSFGFSSLSEAGHHKKHPSAVVVGTVYCHTCFQQDVSRNSHFIPGASVLVQCKGGNLKESFWKEVKTDEHGEFQVDLPFTVSRYVKRIKRCSVKLINSSEPYCAVASSATSSSLHLKSRKDGIHMFSAGFFTFKPLKQPTLCRLEPSVHDSRVINRKTGIGGGDTITFPPPIQRPKVPKFRLLPFPSVRPPFPQLPKLPSLPPLPGLPCSLPPLPGKGSPVTKGNVAQPDHFFHPFFPPNLLEPSPPPLLPPKSFQPPGPPLHPSSLPPPPAPLNPSAPRPKPFQPPGPPLPPNSLQPPPAPLNPSPPIPGPTPSPTPSPSVPIPPPPFPFAQPPFSSFPPSSTP